MYLVNLGIWGTGQVMSGPDVTEKKEGGGGDKWCLPSLN